MKLENKKSQILMHKWININSINQLNTSSETEVGIPINSSKNRKCLPTSSQERQIVQNNSFVNGKDLELASAYMISYSSFFETVIHDYNINHGTKKSAIHHLSD